VKSSSGHALGRASEFPGPKEERAFNPLLEFGGPAGISSSGGPRSTLRVFEQSPGQPIALSFGPDGPAERARFSSCGVGDLSSNGGVSFSL